MTTRTLAPSAGPAVRRRPVPWRKLAWVTLRQRRGLLIGGGILLGLFTVYLVVMAVFQNNAYAAVAACHPAAAVKCQQLNNSFYRTYWGGGAGPVIASGGAQSVSSLLFAIPVLLGVFAGAPLLARELENGTFRFAWTQGAGRTRWTVSTLVLPAIILVAATGAFTAIFYWYFRPFLEDQQVSEMLPLGFALLGVAFAAWTLLAYSVAAFLGALFRRTLPAMAVTLVVYIALAMATATAFRPHYATPVTEKGWNNGAVWVISQWAKAPNGHVLSQSAMNNLSQQVPASVQNSPSPDAFTNWLTQHGYTLWQSVQPDSRFWQFQLTEGGWLLVVSAALIAGTVWLVRRRGALQLGLRGEPVLCPTGRGRAGLGLRSPHRRAGLADTPGPCGALPHLVLLRFGYVLDDVLVHDDCSYGLCCRSRICGLRRRERIHRAECDEFRRPGQSLEA